jgi:hypothetical protein
MEILQYDLLEQKHSFVVKLFSYYRAIIVRDKWSSGVLIMGLSPGRQECSKNLPRQGESAKDEASNGQHEARELLRDPTETAVAKRGV